MMRNAETSRKIWEMDVKEANSLLGLGHKHILWMENKNMAARTISTRKCFLGYFLAWCREQEILYAEEITTEKIEKYWDHLKNSESKRSENGLLSGKSCVTYMKAVKAFLNWLVRKDYVRENVAEDLKIKEGRERLPKILTTSEIERIINVPDVTTKLGIRNRAILETLYATGIRGTELIKLSIYDIDCEQEILQVREGKGGKDRIVPMGTRACHWVKKYLEEVRPKLAGQKEETLFLTRRKQGFSNVTTLGLVIAECQKKAEVKIYGRCHIFRHALGVQMLRNGASTRYIQEILGHKNLSTTQIYTRIAIEDLKKVHKEYHPAEVED